MKTWLLLSRVWDNVGESLSFFKGHLNRTDLENVISKGLTQVAAGALGVGSEAWLRSTGSEDLVCLPPWGCFF